MTGSTDDLEREKRLPAEQMNVDADAAQELIGENARVAQDQKEYAIRYEALATRFEETKVRYEEVSEQIALKGIQRREPGRFIKTPEDLPEMVTQFREALRGSMVNHVTVYVRDNIVFTLTSGMEVKV